MSSKIEAAHLMRDPIPSKLLEYCDNYNIICIKTDICYKKDIGYTSSITKNLW